MYKAIIDKALSVDARMYSLESEGRKNVLKAIPQDNSEPIICGTFYGDTEEFWDDFRAARERKEAEEDEDEA